MSGPTWQLNFNMEKIKQHKEIVVVIAVILGFIFYWVQIRPVSIKEECSWFTEIIPASAGITKEQVGINKKLFVEECATEKSLSFRCFNLTYNNLEKPPQPEREETREATKSEYDTCLRHNGL